MRIINGKKIAQKLLMSLKEKINMMKVKPGLAVVLVGNNPSSLLYVRNKEKAAKKIGVNFELYKFGASATNQTLISRIKNLNKRKDIHGIIVQLPLPKHLDVNKIISAIDPKKDVDGFRLNSFYVSPVAQAILQLLEATKEEMRGRKAILFMKSEIFAKSIKKLLEEKGLNVQIILKPSLKELERYAKEGDVIVTALGKPYILKSQMIKNGAIVIDVGITPLRSSFKVSDISSIPPLKVSDISSIPPLKVSDISSIPPLKVRGGKGGLFKFVGDFDSHGIKNKKGFYTPVPGGVGPLTVAMLLRNVVIATKLNK